MRVRTFDLLPSLFSRPVGAVVVLLPIPMYAACSGLLRVWQVRL